MFNNLTTVKKVALGFALLTLVLVAAVGLTIWQVARTRTVADRLITHYAPMTEASLRILNGLNDSVAGMRGWMLLGEDEFKTDRATAWSEDIEPALAELKRLTQESGNPTETDPVKLVERELTELKKYQQGVEDMAPTDKDAANARVRDQTAPRAKKIRETLEAFISDQQPRVKQNREAVVSLTTFLTLMEWILLAVGVTISAGLATAIIRNVKSSIGAVLTATQEVSASSTEIATGSQQQVASLNQTATSLNEITTTAEEFKATMQEFADRARAVQEAAQETAKQSSEGRKLTQESAARIDQLRANSQAAGESVLNLAEQMQRIGEITATVNEIAEQTKLLALNAAIEAARAGEEGRGFAVVATQVRELANQSKEAAGRIESLIGGTQKSVQQVVNKIEEGNRLSDESTQIVRQMTQSFEEIARAIEQTTEAMSQINTGAKQQEQGISELVSSIAEIDTGSRESLAAAQQTQKAIVSIDTQLKRLNETMATF